MHVHESVLNDAINYAQKGTSSYLQKDWIVLPTRSMENNFPRRLESSARARGDARMNLLASFYEMIMYLDS